MPAAKESSTVEWHNAQVMPTDFSCLPSFENFACTPTTAFNFSSVSVVAGSSRSTLPCLMACTTAGGSASASTFRPTPSAVFGLTPAPTPPFLTPSIACCRRSCPLQNASSPKVSKRKICLPCSYSAFLDCWSVFADEPASGTPGGALEDKAGTASRTPQPRMKAAAMPPTRSGLTVGRLLMTFSQSGRGGQELVSTLQAQ